MKGPLYDWDRHRWTDIDTDTDRRVSPEHAGPAVYVTRGGFRYEVSADGKRYHALQREVS